MSGRVAFLNMVSSAAPARGGETHKVCVIGFALAVEDEGGTIVRQLVRRVAIPGDRRLDLAWATKYGIAEWEADVPYIEPAQAAVEALAALAGVTQIAAHFVQFHREQLRVMIDDGGGRFDVLADMDWFDTVHRSTKACAIPARHGRGFKPPSLAEAAEILTGTALRPLDGLPWAEALLVNLSATRDIWRALNGREVRGPLVPADTAEDPGIVVPMREHP